MSNTFEEMEKKDEEEVKSNDFLGSGEMAEDMKDKSGIESIEENNDESEKLGAENISEDRFSDLLEGVVFSESLTNDEKIKRLSKVLGDLRRAETALNVDIKAERRNLQAARKEAGLEDQKNEELKSASIYSKTEKLAVVERRISRVRDAVNMIKGEEEGKKKEKKEIVEGELVRDLTMKLRRLSSFFKEREDRRLTPLFLSGELEKIGSGVQLLEQGVSDKGINREELIKGALRVIEVLDNLGRVRANEIRDDPENLEKIIAVLRIVSNAALDVGRLLGPGEKGDLMDARNVFTNLDDSARRAGIFLKRKLDAFGQYRRR